MSAGLSLVYTVVMSQQCTYDCAVGVFHSAACGRYIDASSHLFDIHYDTTQGFKHGKNMYLSKSRHGPYNI